MGIGKNFMTSFVDSTINTFKVQVGVDVTPQKPFMSADPVSISCDISGIIGVTSEEFAGSLALLFPAETFLGIVSKMLMEDFKEINSENESAAGELANIILGQAKRELNEHHGQAIQIALPSIITGKDHIVKSMVEGEESFIIPFSSEYGMFHVKINIEK